ncbi:MAG: SDR family oxidoreductase [Planctomycetes bacterium]|nr:SDR family oxidoreductase [Planctomycetota bacterium]
MLRGCLIAGHRMAVLVRPARGESARRRIDAILARWETETNQLLPRAVVFEGDLRRPDLGLGASDRRWIGRHCRAVIHSAARLTFYGTDPQREPWISNVEGTRHVLELCRQCGIPEFHHVSTAYVCGLREGRILETELDVGQETGNDYERSKIEAEKLVLSAGLEHPPTIYRPSIIVGDSQTGYTSTFHGFYAMVRLAHTLVRQMVLGSITADQMMETFHIDGHERKDYVPVDWVAAAITHLLGRPEHHGRTYHLTAAEPTPVAVWSRAIQHAVERYSTLADPSDPTIRDAQWFADLFREQAKIYRAYWRDDPQFDRTNTVAALAHLPCPTVDYDMLLRMARFAIQTNFGRRERKPSPLNGDIRTHLRQFLEANDAHGQEQSWSTSLGLEVSGHGGGQWKLLARDGRVRAAEEGIHDQCGAIFHLTSDTFHRLADRQLSVSQAVLSGQVAISGTGTRPDVLETLLQSVVTPENE